MSRREDVTVEAVVERRGGADAPIAVTTYFLPTHRGEIAVRVARASGEVSVRAPRLFMARLKGLWAFPKSRESYVEIEFVAPPTEGG